MREFEPDHLRALVAFADTGTLARAAEVVGRTPSAVTAQMQRLEEVAGVALLRPAGRGRELTEAGNRLVAHARTILGAHRAAWASLATMEPEGQVSLGLTQDFTGSPLIDALRAFSGSRPRVRTAFRVGRSAELSEQLAAGDIDVLVAMRQEVRGDEVASFSTPMRWLAPADGVSMLPGAPLPLALLDPPCGFRDAALRALDKAGLDYRIVATGVSLDGVFAAVRAGIGITARLEARTHDGIIAAPVEMALPPLPHAEFSIRLRDGAEASAEELAELLRRTFETQLHLVG